MADGGKRTFPLRNVTAAERLWNAATSRFHVMVRGSGEKGEW
jgi:hypothetical protein